jgi:hypothetical protein
VTARRVLYVAVGAATVTYVALAPFGCATTSDLVGLPAAGGVQQRCSGLVAFDYYGARNLLAPQAIITSVIVGTLSAFFFWLIAARPKAPSGLKLVVGLMLVALTLASAASLGGVIVYAAPVLIPSYWWMASHSGRLARIVWSLLAALVAFYAWSVLAYMISWNTFVGLGALVMALASSVPVYLAPGTKEPDLWAQP